MEITKAGCEAIATLVQKSLHLRVCMHYLEQLLGEENAARLFAGIQILGELAIFLCVRKLRYDYRQLLIQHGFVHLLYSTLLEDSSCVNWVQLGLGFLNTLGLATFFAILPDNPLLTVMLFYNFKSLLLSSARLGKSLSSCQFIMGFLLAVLKVWILILGQVSSTMAEFLQHKYVAPEYFDSRALHVSKGLTMVVFGLLNFQVVSMEQLNDFNLINFDVYLLIFFIPCAALLCLARLKMQVQTHNTHDHTSSLLYGIQLLILLFNNSFTFLTLISPLFYFAGIACLYIQFNQQN